VISNLKEAFRALGCTEVPVQDFCIEGLHRKLRELHAVCAAVPTDVVDFAFRSAPESRAPSLSASPADFGYAPTFAAPLARGARVPR
jgi:hypothetical protein